MTIPAGVATFQDLARWLIDTRHDGEPYGMAKALKTSAGLPYQWRDGLVKTPKRETIERLCEVYGLDFWEVYKLTIGPPTRRRRGAAVVLLALSLLGLAGRGSAEAQPLAVDSPVVTIPVIGNRLRRWWEGRNALLLCNAATA